MAEIVQKQVAPSDIAGAQTWGERGSTALAFLALLAVDGVMKIAGFNYFYRMMKSFPTVGKVGDSQRKISIICPAVDRAASVYFKRAWCLQRSATAACLLRLRGVPAELVIGVQKMPFYAHAWVEFGGQVINDSPAVQSRYNVMERC